MFTVEEIKDLMDALNSWEKDDEGSLLTTLMGGMLHQNEEARKDFLDEQEVKMKEEAQERENRKERSILLKAKLISMRDKAEAKEFGSSIA